MPSEIGLGQPINQRQDSALSMINPYSMWFDNAFWKWQAMRLAPFGARMLPGLANEQKWAQMIRAPYGTRGLIYPWITPSRKAFYREQNAAIGKLYSEVEKKELRGKMYEHLLSKDIATERSLLTQGGGVEALKSNKLGKGGLVPGFFIGQMVGGALGLGTGGQIGLGIAGSVAVKASGGIAPLMYKAGMKRPAEILSQFVFGTETEVGRKAFNYLFGARSGFDGLVSELNRGFRSGPLVDKVNEISSKWSKFTSPIETVPTINKKYVSSIIGADVPGSAIENILSKAEFTLPGRSLGLLGMESGSRIANNSIREAIFNRGFRNMFVTEKSMKKRMVQNIQKEMTDNLVSFANEGNTEAINNMFSDKSLAKGKALARDKMISRKIEGYALSDEGRGLIKQFATTALETEAGQTAVAHAAKLARRVSRVAIGGVAVGIATTGLLATQAVMATYRFALQGANVISSTLRSMSRYDFGKGFAVETPQATSERAMAMESIQNAMGMGRSLLGNEAAYMH